MNGYLDRLNLRPFEKRLVVVVFLLLFIVINAVFVVPHFSDWRKVKSRMARAQRTLNLYRSTADEAPRLKSKIEEIQSAENAAVPPEEQATQFATAILNQAVQSGVTITSTSKQTTRTNQFFLEQGETVSVTAKEEQLVEFLYGLGSGGSLIRVRDLSLKPDPPRQQLNANIKLVASYQKKNAGRGLPASSGGRSTTPVSPRERFSSAKSAADADE